MDKQIHVNAAGLNLEVGLPDLSGILAGTSVPFQDAFNLVARELRAAWAAKTRLIVDQAEQILGELPLLNGRTGTVVFEHLRERLRQLGERRFVVYDDALRSWSHACLTQVSVEPVSAVRTGESNGFGRELLLRNDGCLEDRRTMATGYPLPASTRTVLCPKRVDDFRSLPPVTLALVRRQANRVEILWHDSLRRNLTLGLCRSLLDGHVDPTALVAAGARGSVERLDEGLDFG